VGFDLKALPPFPWDRLEPIKKRAARHPRGLLDFSVGAPVDPTPEALQEALRASSNAPGYPLTVGTPDLREAVSRHYTRRRGVPDLDPAGVIPTIGSKEAVAALPSLLGLGAGDAVVHPEIAYPTYEVGALLAGARPVRADFPAAVPDSLADSVRLVYLNSPSNPTGRVDSVEALRGWVAWARGRGAVVAADECYAAFAWSEPWVSGGVPSLLDPRVSGGDPDGLLVLGSASKQWSAAGYRAAWLAGDPALVGRIAEIRKHMGMMSPTPIQAALVAALDDDASVDAQRERYGRRRVTLRHALEEAGYQVEGSEAGLYLWFTTPGGQDGWRTVEDLADLGILVAPGAFYGPGGANFARLALTAPDDSVAEAAARLAPA
jgi:succinyldiaminopimelate transaminase